MNEEAPVAVRRSKESLRKLRGGAPVGPSGGLGFLRLQDLWVEAGRVEQKSRDNDDDSSVAMVVAAKHGVRDHEKVVRQRTVTV